MSTKKILAQRLMLFALAALCFKLLAAQIADKAGLPSPIQDPMVLSAADKADLAEALRLKTEIGDRVWPGFGSADIPFIVYNDSNEFLMGEAKPAGSWEVVDKDNFLGRPYYRRAAKNPQAFAVKTGTHWAGSFTTLDQRNRESPLKLVSDFHIIAILHEMLHAFQADKVPARFAKALDIYAAESRYPAKDKEFAAAWNSEGAALAEALRATDDAEAFRLVQKFLQIRDARRQHAVLSPDLLAYERELEWLEGLAKFAEIRFYEFAASHAGEAAYARYRPGLPFYLQWDFVRLERQLGQQNGDLRFYSSGMAQARLLDRLSPGWKANVMKDGVYLEDLLRAIVWR